MYGGSVMVDKWFAIQKILLDKGLLAILVAAFTFFFSRSVERLKASLSWGAELLKQRMDAAKQVLHEARDLQRDHLAVLGGLLIERTGKPPTVLFEHFEKIEDSKTKLIMLRVEESAISALDQVLSVASRVIGAQPPGESGTLVNGEDGSTTLRRASPDRNEWMENERRALAESIGRFQAKLAGSFPPAD
jgi:hypothetical protein